MEEMTKIFRSFGFTGTRYPHRPTMKALGIHRDIEYLLDLCNLVGISTSNSNAYKEETCQFLASLNFQAYDSTMTQQIRRRGFGHISFTIHGTDYTMTAIQLGAVFGFPYGCPYEPEYAPGELDSLWKTIGDAADYSSSRAKSAAIRSPVIRYVHKTMANTFFARKVTGNVKEPELQLLANGLKDVIEVTRDGRHLQGDLTETGLAMTLIDQLLSYRYWATKLQKKRLKGEDVSGELCIGGVVTQILQAAGVPLLSEPVAPRWIDYPYLTKIGFLDRNQPEGIYLYQFSHPEAGESRVMLPFPQVTSIRMGCNVDFWPPTNSLFTEQPPHPFISGDIEHETEAAAEEEGHEITVQAPTQSDSSNDEIDS